VRREASPRPGSRRHQRPHRRGGFCVRVQYEHPSCALTDPGPASLTRLDGEPASSSRRSARTLRQVQVKLMSSHADLLSPVWVIAHAIFAIRWR